jgi:hypothetical protein
MALRARSVSAFTARRAASELRRNLDSLLLKYTEEHPDVKATRHAIAQLRADARKSSGGGPCPLQYLLTHRASVV